MLTVPDYTLIQKLLPNVQKVEMVEVRYEQEMDAIFLYRVYNHLNWRYYSGFYSTHLDRYPPKGEHGIFLEKISLLLHPFPHDPKLEGLSLLQDPEAMRKYFPVHSVELLSYTPYMRATFQYDQQVIGKTNIYKDPALVYDNHVALANEGSIPVPDPITYFKWPPITLQQKVIGAPLVKKLQSPLLNQWVAATGKALARLHSSPLVFQASRLVDRELQTLERWRLVLYNAIPELRSLIQQFSSEIRKRMQSLPQSIAPIHADFHPTNVFVSEDGEIKFIDLDDLSMGDPCVDIGRFLSALRMPSKQIFGSINSLRPQRDLFIETYLEHRKEDRARIRLFEAASLFISAGYLVRLQRDNLRENCSLLLQEVEDLLKRNS